MNRFKGTQKIFIPNLELLRHETKILTNNDPSLEDLKVIPQNHILKIPPNDFYFQLFGKPFFQVPGENELGKEFISLVRNNRKNISFPNVLFHLLKKRNIYVPFLEMKTVNNAREHEENFTELKWMSLNF